MTPRRLSRLPAARRRRRRGDPDEPTNREIEPEPGWTTGPRIREDYDPGPEADDEGGMPEYRYILAEDYQRGQS